MPSDITALRYALLTADTRSFARAAAQAGVKQATLSRRIAGLEDRIGFKLFDRSTRGAYPTSIGLQWLNDGRRLLTDLNRLHSDGRAIGAGQSGAIKIGFSTSLAAGNLRALISDFVKRFPELRIEGVEGDRLRLTQALHARSVDFAVLAGDLVDSELASRPLWSERIMVALGDDHSLLDRERIYWTDMRRERFVLPQQDPGADLADVARARLGEPGRRPLVEVHEISRDNVLSMIPIGRFVSLTTDAVLGRTLTGVTLRQVFDASNSVSHVDYLGYWRRENQNPSLAQLLQMIDSRYPS
jgi:DNA-binding transcriptional LysR family regulator